MTPEPLDPARLDRMIDHALSLPQERERTAQILSWRRPAVWAGLPALAASLLLVWALLPARPAALQAADYAEVSDLMMMELVDEL